MIILTNFFLINYNKADLYIVKNHDMLLKICAPKINRIYVLKYALKMFILYLKKV